MRTVSGYTQAIVMFDQWGLSLPPTLARPGLCAVLSCMPVSPWSVLADCGPETRRSWHRREVALYSWGGPQRVRLCSCAPDGYSCLTNDLCLNDEGWWFLGDRGGNQKLEWIGCLALLLCVFV